MDKLKNPNIKVEAILLEKLNFERKPKVPDKLMDSKGDIEEAKLELNGKIERIFTEDKKALLVKLELEINDENKTLNILCRIVGIFSQIEPGSITLEEFAKTNAPAILFPYIRENISNVTMKAGLPPLILPPINVIKLVEESENKNKQEKN